MKKTFVITLILGFLISCGNNKTVSEIDNYVIEIDKRTDLSESITEFITEDSNDEIVGGITIYELTDKNGKIYRIMAEIVQPSQSPANYEFYFKKDTLTFARIIEFDETGNDTITNSEYYFKGIELIKQLDKQGTEMTSETVRKASEFYLVYGKETTE